MDLSKEHAPFGSGAGYGARVTASIESGAVCHGNGPFRLATELAGAGPLSVRVAKEKTMRTLIDGDFTRALTKSRRCFQEPRSIKFGPYFLL